MTRWDEAGLSEDPAVATLLALGWTYVSPETLLAERHSMIEVVVAGRPAVAFRVVEANGEAGAAA
jgi:hypothetical protein